mgnify:FL=1
MKNMTFQKQILFIFVFSVGFTIVFSFFFLHHLYSKLYLDSIRESLIHQGKNTVEHYHFGELSEDIVNKINWYNVISPYEIIVVDQLENLTTYFPYQINYESLVNPKDIVQLEQGNYVMKEGYVKELDREILGAIFPIKSGQSLIGVIYIYVPLADIQAVFIDSIPILLIVGIIFFLLLFLIVKQIWKSIYRPLNNLEQLANDISKGHYKQLNIERQDEIGNLTRAFNEMSESLAEQEERKKEFIANVVHELRTPLTYVRGYVEALRDKYFTSREDANHYLNTIEKETERISKLINDLEDLMHLQENLFSVDLQPIVISQILYDTLDLFHIHRSEKNLAISSHIDDSLIIYGDPDRIHQVFYNTIDNAFKYASANSVVTIRLFQEDDQAKFSINNRGTTINQEDLKRIGERFFRTDKARSRKTGGTGLGISIVKEIVRLHHATFSITSSEEEGTTVTIAFPLMNESEESN